MARTEKGRVQAWGRPDRFRNLSGDQDDTGTGNAGDDPIGPIDLTDSWDSWDRHDDPDPENGWAKHVSSRSGNRLKPFKKSPDGIEVKGDGQPVGYDEYADDAFTTVKLQLRKDGMLYIFSDGYADQFGGPKGKKFRYGPFKELLTGLHEKALDQQKEELDRTFEDWKAEGEQEQIDDVVVVGIRL